MRHKPKVSQDSAHMRNWLRYRAWPVLYDTWAGYMKHDGLVLSAAMAYAAAFSLFPLCLVLMAVLGFVMRFSSQRSPSNNNCWPPCRSESARGWHSSWAAC